MTISYVANIPAATHDPSADQPDMLTNTNSIQTIWGVDHYTFGAPTNTPNGTHKQVTMPVFASPSTPTTGAAVLYSAAGTADSANAQCFYKNPDGTFLLSGIRAFATISIPGLAITNSYNVASVVNTGGTNYAVTLVANSINGNNATVLLTLNAILSASGNGVLVTSIVNPVINVLAFSPTIQGFNIMVLQI